MTKLIALENIKITSAFGTRIHPITKEEKFHNGIDIAAPTGTSVRCPGNCIVEACYVHKRGGKTVILRDEDTNDRYGFCHLDSFSCTQGQQLKKKEVFAEVGNTGASTGPHLHFSYATNCAWKNGRVAKPNYVDPIPKIDIV